MINRSYADDKQNEVGPLNNKHIAFCVRCEYQHSPSIGLFTTYAFSISARLVKSVIDWSGILFLKIMYPIQKFKVNFFEQFCLKKRVPK